MISIHALLAESDLGGRAPQPPQGISIHALLAESDPLADGAEPHAAISIHALLAESDDDLIAYAYGLVTFLSTLSLRRATDRSAE